MRTSTVCARILFFDATVSELRLDEKAGHWAVSFESGSVLESRHVINGMGVLHKPSIPDVEGKVSFSGQAMHTARWNHSVDFNDRRVAIIGSAASAVQVVPQIAKAASKLTVFQRTPNYIASRGDRQYSDKEKQRFAKWPWVQRLYRWMIHKRMDMLLYSLTRRDSRIGRMAARKIKKRMRASVDDPDLHAALSPDYDMGCKRILLSDDFFEALNRDNVELVDRTIAAIETNGVRSDDGRLHEVDIIVYATGFDIEGHMRSIQVYGRAGKSLHDEWRDGPRAYLGASMVGFPNYWMTTGPNTGVGTTSAVYTIEESIRHITNLIEASECRYLVDTQRSSQDAYNESIETAFEQTVWSSGCDSYYIGKSGRILTLYPYNAARFRSQLASVSLNDFKLENAEGEHED